MFTGLIEELGTVLAIDRGEDTARLTIGAKTVLDDVRDGDSITVNGCCLTVTSFAGDRWTADVIATTLRATNLGGLEAGDPVNLERSVTAGTRLGGHIVQGHVDGVATLRDRTQEGLGQLLEFELPADLALQRYLVDRGSVAIDGISLTVVTVREGTFTIGLIPETLSRTTLGTLPIGGEVNIEVDVLAKYVESLLPHQSSPESRLPQGESR